MLHNIIDKVLLEIGYNNRTVHVRAILRELDSHGYDVYTPETVAETIINYVSTSGDESGADSGSE